MKKTYFLSIVLTLVSVAIWAQSGPGGIGNVNGEGTLKAWYKADSGVTYDGSNKVSEWINAVNVADLDIFASGSLMPDYVASELNSKPTISFTGSNRLTTAVNLTTDNFPTNEVTTFIVFNADNNSQNSTTYGTYPLETQRLSAHLPWSGSYYFDIGTCCDGTSRISDGFSSAGTFNIWAYTANSSTGKTLFLDNNQINNVAGVNTYSSHASHQFALGQSFSGDIAEFILYKERLNAAERTIVSNYLALKYNISLSGGNLYANSNYQNDIKGIGQVTGEAKTSSSSAGFYISENGGLANGDFIFFAHDGVTNDSPSTSDLPGGVEERWSRDWYVEKTGGLDAKLTFDLPEGIEGDYPTEIANYVLLYRSGTSGNYSTVSATVSYGDNDQVSFAVADADLINGYYTLGTTDANDSPVEGKPGLTWYTLASGNWTNTDIWTLDPSGALPNNPSSAYPNLSSDNIVVKNGKTVTVDLNNLSCTSLTVEGRLDLGTTSGHSFLSIKGDGRIIMEADNFPTGDATHFITKGQGEGTVEFNGGNYSLTSSREFYDVEINQNTSLSTITLLNDLSINGNLTLQKGVLKINDDAATTILNLDVDGSVDVQTNSSIIVGTGNTIGSHSIPGTIPASGDYHNIYHQLTVGGNFTNNGTVKLTNLNAPVYNQFASDGGVTLKFTGASDNTFFCYNTTDLYNLVVDKGVDRTYNLELYADDSSYFRLFGANNYGRNESSPFSSSDPEVRKALWVYNGTLKLTGSIYIPTLSEGSAGGGNGDYAIGYNAKLWIAGADVKVYTSAGNADDIPGFTSSDTHTAVGVSSSGSHSALSLYGGFQIDNGLFDTDNSFGFVFWDSANPTAEINGGSVIVEKLYQVGSGTVTYKQTGGKLTKVGSGDFDLSNTDAVFQMSGGEIEMQTGNFYVGAQDGNYNVTGGTVKINQSGGASPIVNTTAPIFDFEISRLNGSGTTTVDLQSELVVLNDLTINANTFLDHNGNDVSIGRNFTIDADAGKADSGDNNYGYLYDAALPNTTTFNGAEDGVFYIGHPFDDNWELYLEKIVVDKSDGKSILVQSDFEKEAANVTSNINSRIINVNDSLTVNSGILNQGNQTLRLFGPINIASSGKLGVYEHGTTHINALLMLKDENINIVTEDGAELGNIKMDPWPNTEIITFTSDVKISRIVYHSGRIDLGNNVLTLDYLHRPNSTTNYLISDGNEATEMFYTDGSSSDGGLRYFIPEGTADNTDFAFPLGVSGKYTPVKVNVANVPAGGGYIQINPVEGELQTTDQNGGDVLSYYWRVRYDSFSAEPEVKFEFTYDESNVAGSNDDNNYYPGRVMGVSPYTRAYINDKGRVDEINNIITYDDGSGGRFTLDVANYTAGKTNRFTGDVEIFYNKRNNQGSWGDKASWFMDADETNAANKIPVAGDVVVIRGDYYTDNITVDGNRACAEIVFIREGNYTDIESLPRLRVRTTDVLTADHISGVGDLYLQHSLSNSATVNADIGDFASNDTSVVEFYTTENGTYDVGELDFFTEVPTLRIYGQGNTNRIVSFNYDINCKNIIVDGRATLYVGGNYSVENLTRLGYTYYGRIQFPNGTTSYTFTTKDFLTRTGKGSEAELYTLDVESGNANGVEHKLIVKGDIDLEYWSSANGSDNVDIDLYNSATENNVILELQGEGTNAINSAFTAAQTNIELYRVVMNKGADQSSSFTINEDFLLSGPTSGAGVAKALELQNGKFVLNNSAISLDLTTGNDDFSIPSPAALEIAQGTVIASGSSGISLDGKLLVSGGTVDMSGGDNAIEYSASGSAEIEVTSGSLTVGSQIRRATSTDEGILSYKQSGGTVIVGQYSAPESSRGVLEVLGTGSHFEHTGGTLQIANGQSNASVASLYLNPETNNLGDGTTITFDPVQSSGINEIGLYSSIPLKNILLKNDANLIVKQWIVPLTVEENFEVESNATFNANGQNLSIGGDFTMGGSFTHGNNTTTFTGSTAQTIQGNAVFYNLTKTGAADLSLNAGDSEINIENIFDFQSGTLNDNSNNVNVQGYCTFAGTHVYGGSGKGLVLNGTSNQKFSGAGTLGMLTISNSAGVDVPLGNEFTINNKLRLEAGIFNIDKNLLSLTETCIIEHGTDDFSSTNMIQNNISFTDNGVKKVFPQVTSGSDPVYNFTYPMGSGGKYTPVTVAITNNDNNTGSLTVKPANEYHPSVEDENNVLQYHWELGASGISGFVSEMRFKYDEADVYVESPSDITDYYTARLLSDGTGDWNKFSGTDVIDEASNELVFDFLGTNDAGISGAYTAGLDAAIPDQVPGYITIADGDWTNENIWDTYPTSGGTVPAGGPRGSLVYISHNVDVPSNFLSVYRTTINSGGTLNIGSTFGHRIGDVSGSGTLKLSDQGSLPAGVFDSFFASSGGTLEYAGSTNYDFLSDINSLNNLVLSGSGERRFPNLDLTILGNITFNGVDAINEHDRNLSIKGDLNFTGGTYDSGTGSSNVTFNGSSVQYINGAGEFTGANSFNHFTINNANNLNINTNIEIDNILYLTTGIVNNSFGYDFAVANTSESAIVGGSSSSNVEGYLIKKINNGGDFNFPVGDGGRYGNIIISETQTSGAQNWKVRYFSNSPANEGLDPNAMIAPVEYVSKNEYWSVEGPNAAKSNLTLRWDDASGVTPDSNFKLVNWATPGSPAWEQISIETPSGDTGGGTVKTAALLTYSDFSNTNYITFGSISIPAYTWLGTTSDWFTLSNWAGGVLPSAASDITINTASNNPVIDPTVNSDVVQLNDLTISAGATLTVKPGARFTVNGNLVTNNGLIIENSNDKPTSFITNGTVTGNIQFDWTYDELRYWYIGHSISNPVIASYDAITGGTNDYFLYNYPGSWNNLTKTTYTFSDPLEGYAVNLKEQGTISHSGLVNNDVSYTRTLGASWYLVANPYPSYIDLSKSSELNFGDALTSIWTRTDLPGDIRGYATYNLASGVGVNGGVRFVPPGQSFWVRNYTASSDFIIKSGARVHTTGVALKSTGGEGVDDVLRFKMVNQYTTDEGVVVFREIGTSELTRFDSEKRIDSNKKVPNVYSLKGEKKVSISLLPEISENRGVLLGYSVKTEGAGVSILRFTNINDFKPGLPVYLEDKLTGTIVDLRQQSEYEFMAVAGEDNGRFELKFEMITTDTEGGIEMNQSDKKATIFAYDASGVIEVVENLLEENTAGEVTITIANMSGKVLHQSQYTNSGRHSISEILNSGVYLITASEKNKGHVSTKLVITDRK
ncbi:T9SS type A sorting domain-containing protein [Labilibacter sediminis]|nr:T9SS type A sorting domain-containing protein [Labilibacter sediminis]